MSSHALVLEKGLPANLDAERFVLGSILLDDSYFIQTAGALEGDSSTPPAGFVARESFSVPLRLPNTTVLHAGGYFARSFSIRGDRNEPRGFLVSPRPVSRCAI